MPTIRWQWRSTNFRKGAMDRGQYRQAAGAIEKALIWGSSVIVITERTRRLVQHNFVEYRGVRFAILFGTVRQQWRVAIYPVPNQLPEERTVFGTRQEAVTTARSMIDARLKKLSLASRTGRSADNG